jgi:hypothetical protein
MSKAEFFQQLETLSPDELDQVAIRIDELRHRAGSEIDLTPTEQAILEKRIKRFEADGNAGEDWPTVRDRVLARIKKK